MRLQAYINEFKEYTLEELQSILERDCKRYLKEMKKARRLLWRGAVGRTIPDIQEVKSHLESGRMPKDTPEEIHDLMNHLFRNRFGWNVRNGISTTGDKGDTTYGPQFIFFPIGVYDYVWSPDVPDLFSELDGRGYTYEFDEMEVEAEYEQTYGNDDEPDIELEDYIKEREEEWEYEKNDYFKTLIKSYKDTGLNPQAIKSKNEIMFGCKTYYLVHKRWEEDIIQWLRVYR